MIPKRKQWANFLSKQAKFFIKKHKPAFASLLGLNSCYHPRQEEIEKVREEASASMDKKRRHSKN